MPQPGFILISIRVAKIRTPRMAMTTVTSGYESTRAHTHTPCAHTHLPRACTYLAHTPTLNTHPVEMGNSEVQAMQL